MLMRKSGCFVCPSHWEPSITRYKLRETGFRLNVEISIRCTVLQPVRVRVTLGTAMQLEAEGNSGKNHRTCIT